MREKYNKIGWTSIFLLIGIIAISLSSMGILRVEGRREIKVAKNFLENLEEKGLLKLKDIKDLKLDKTNLSTKSLGTNKIISNKTYNIEVNENLEVITFSSNDYSNEKNLEYREAIDIAMKYIGVLGKDEYEFIKVGESTLDEKLPYYSLRFSKMKDGYPYYGIEVLINIDKGNGHLVGYTNRLGKVEVNKPDIKIEKEVAEKIAIAELSNFNKDVKTKKETYLAYYRKSNEENNAALTYIVNLKSKNQKGKVEEYLYFLNSNTGEIVNKLGNIDAENIVN